MPQVQNLLDLFQKNRRDAQAPAVDGKSAAKASPAQGKASRGGDLLPPGADPKGNSGVSPSRPSFGARMEKSKAKLAAKDGSPKEADASQRHTAPARHEGPRPKTEAPDNRNDGPRQNPASRNPHADRAGRPDRTDRTDRAEARRNAGNEGSQDRGADTAADSAPSDHCVRPDAASAAQGEGETGLSQSDADAIKAGLDKLGIQVEDGQLDDPAFLMDMLRMLQAMPAQTLPEEGVEAQAVPETVEGADAAQAVETSPALPDGDIMPEAPAAPQTESAPAAPESKAMPEAPKALSRKELARLVEGRIAGLERAAQAAQTAPAHGTAQAPSVTPREWQGVQARAHAEGPSPDPMPMADLDRLRVMQAAAAQSAPAKDQGAAMHTDFALESDSVEPASPTGTASASEAGRESSGTPDRDAQADLNGGNGDHAAGAAPAGSPKDGAQAAKGGETAPQFHQVLDQVRASDHRPAAAPGAEPRAEAHGAAVLDQIARKLTVSAARKPGDEISIQLSPEHLGKVRVSLEMKEDGMSARIAVENDSVRKQVEANLGALKDALRDQGIQLQGMEVSVDQRHGSLFNPDGSNAESFFRRQGRGEGGGRGGREDESSPLEAAPESDTGRRWGYNTMEYIG
jgi:flagellar hook-length control protein FliK